MSATAPRAAPAPAGDEYARIASVYDMVTAPFLDGLRLEVAALAAGAPKGPALDVCCGTGRQVAVLSAQGLSAFGTDLSPAMLGRARAQAGRHRLFLANAACLPLPDRSLALATIAFALHEKPAATAAAIFAEMLRVTRPGGRIVIADYALPQTALGRGLRVAVKAVERLAGSEHYACYRAFMAGGGLEGFLSRQARSRYTFLARRCGLVGLAVIDVG